MKGRTKQYEVFKFEREDKIAFITLNRPETLNAFTWKFPEELYRVLAEIAEDRELKVVVLKAEGNVFSAGADLNTMKMADTPYKVKTFMSNLNSSIKKMMDMPQPVVCAMNGAGAGGGANLALSARFCHRFRARQVQQCFHQSWHHSGYGGPLESLPVGRSDACERNCDEGTYPEC